MATENTGAKKRLLDMNASWPLMIVYLGYLIGAYFISRLSNFSSNDVNSYGYVFATVIIGLIVTALIYNLGKLLFAKIAGYEVITFKCLGLIGERKKKVGDKYKLAFRYDIISFFDVQLSFAPKDDNVSKKPTLIFVGGFVFEIFFAIICILLFVFFGLGEGHPISEALIGWGALSAFLYGFIIILYELIPFRQDYPNDVYNLIKTHKEEDVKAYNILKINEKREYTGEDFIIPDFEDYDSFYKAQTLQYLYLSQLYADDYDKATKTLAKIKYFDKYLLDYQKHFAPSENIYLRYLVGDTAGADRIFCSLKSDDRKMTKSVDNFADLRIALLVNAAVAKNKESLEETVNEYKKLSKSLIQSERIKKEEALFKQVYDGLKKSDNSLELPSLD